MGFSLGFRSKMLTPNIITNNGESTGNNMQNDNEHSVYLGIDRSRLVPGGNSGLSLPRSRSLALALSQGSKF